MTGTPFDLPISLVMWNQSKPKTIIWFGFMVFYATFNNISAISWRSVLLVEETRVPVENHRSVTSHWQILSHNVVLSTPHHEPNYHTITTTTAPTFIWNRQVEFQLFKIKGYNGRSMIWVEQVYKRFLLHKFYCNQM